MDRRVELDDKLIFDILLASGGIRDPEFLYPPRDPEGLERLLDAIQNSTYDILKKHTLIYFLLKWHMDGRENTFKNTFSIPPHFSALADAYWGLDSGTEVAVSSPRRCVTDIRRLTSGAESCFDLVRLAFEQGSYFEDHPCHFACSRTWPAYPQIRSHNEATSGRASGHAQISLGLG